MSISTEAGLPVYYFLYCALNGLRDASLAWLHLLSSLIKPLGLLSDAREPCLFSGAMWVKDRWDRVIIVMYVDDLLIITESGEAAVSSTSWAERYEDGLIVQASRHAIRPRHFQFAREDGDSGTHAGLEAYGGLDQHTAGTSSSIFLPRSSWAVVGSQGVVCLSSCEAELHALQYMAQECVPLQLQTAVEEDEEETCETFLDVQGETNPADMMTKNVGTNCLLTDAVVLEPCIVANMEEARVYRVTFEEFLQKRD
eukprot:s255_g16.t1